MSGGGSRKTDYEIAQPHQLRFIEANDAARSKAELTWEASVPCPEARPLFPFPHFPFMGLNAIVSHSVTSNCLN